MTTTTLRRQIATAAVAFVATLAGPASALDVFSDPGDGFIEFRGAGGPWPAVHPSFDGSGGEGFFMNIGEWFGDGLTSAIMPFELPNLGSVEDPFLTASLGVHLFEIGTAQATNVDLYAVRTDSTPALASTDYYSGSAFDPNALLLQEDFLTPASQPANPAEPNIFTDSSGDAALLTYLNDTYDGGAGAGQFVFLRLSYGGDGFAAGFDAYKITSRNAGGGEGDFPVLRLTTTSIPGDTNNNSIVEFEPDFGPIRDNWLETNESFGATLARTDGDLDLNGEVSIEDFREWKTAFLGVGGTEAQVALAYASLGVPEPTSLAVAAVGLLGLAASPRRRS